MRILAVLALVGAGAIWGQGAPIYSESGSRQPPPRERTWPMSRARESDIDHGP